MKIQVISDIHLEFGMREIDFNEPDLLILAGDIHIGDAGFRWIAEKVKHMPVIYVLGNHEYYRNSYPRLLNSIKKSAHDTNIHILENESICIEGITFHGATLWTDFELFGNSEIAGYEGQLRMNDYQLIRRDPSYSKLRAVDTRMIHNESIKWLGKSLNDSKTKTNVVISHHAPSIKSIPVEFHNDLINAAFASNLEDFIRETKPGFWIHGHVHEASDYFIHQTRIICNPKGYPGEKVGKYADRYIIEINA